MRRPMAWRGMRAARVLMAGGLLTLTLPAEVWARQEPVPATAINQEGAPLVVTSLKVTLVETFSTPTQVAAGDANVKRSSVRYANRAGLTPSTFVLRGQLTCENDSQQTIEAVELAIIAFDPFHQPMRFLTQRGLYQEHQETVRIPRRSSTSFEWEYPLGTSKDLHEVTVVVRRVRFQDGTIWTAPTEEVTDIF